MPEDPKTPDQTKYARLRTLYMQAMERDPAERDRFLDEQCPDDTDLRAQVLSMLDVASESEDFLDALGTEHLAPILDAEREPMAAGQAVGPFTVVRELGRGGMGVVYLAERTDGQFEQQVALKLLKLGMDSQAILKSFLRERQILAWLRHDAIAQLFDGGLTDDGRPYFAMEYVPGASITEYCDAKKLTVTERLRLLRRVGDAVQYAHRNLVVHRDLKPSNVMVTESGDVKLLDFGVAKILDDDASNRTLTGFSAMTPECASPEQLLGKPVTTTTDVYALGLVLYELLTGRGPYRFESRSIPEIARFIAETPPTLPSTAVRHTDELRRRGGETVAISPRTVSEARGTRPDRLRRELTGDLDTIVLTAIQENPERRYASVEAFMEDIDRFLDGMPIRARPDTLGYRLRKFARRNALAVGAATVIAFLLVGSAVMSKIQQSQTEREREKVEQVNDFVLDLFQAANPATQGGGNSVTARELLDLGVERVDSDLANRPLVQAEMLTMIGASYRALGLYDVAEPLLRRSLSIRERELGANHTDVAESLNELGSVTSLLGNAEEGEELKRRALTMWQKVHRGDHVAIAHGLGSLASSVRKKGNYDEADSLARAALAMHKRIYGPKHLEVAEGMVILANCLLAKDEFAQAEELYRDALDLRQEIHGGDHVTIAGVMSNLGVLLADLERLDEAESLHREALAMQRRLRDSKSVRIVPAMNNLAGVLGRKGELEEAEALHREALVLRRGQFGDESSDVALGLNNLATIVQRQGKMDEAEELYRESLAINRKILGDHPRVALSQHNFAAFLRERGDYDQAVEQHRESLELLQTKLGPEHVFVGLSKSSLALALHLKGAHEEAEVLFNQALAIFRVKYPDGHTRTADALMGLGELMLDQGRNTPAQPLLREAYDMNAALLPEGHGARAAASAALGACLSALGQRAEAEALLIAGFESLKSNAGEARKRRRATVHLVAHYERYGMSDRAAAVGLERQ